MPPIFVDSIDISAVFVDGVEQDTVFVDGVEVFVKSSFVPIDPNDIPILLWNYDADPAFIVQTSNRINQWIDQGPNVATMIGLLNGRPNYVNPDANFAGRPSVNSPNPDQLMNQTNIPAVIFPYTWAFVYKWNAVENLNHVMIGRLSTLPSHEIYQDSGFLQIAPIAGTGGINLFPQDALAHILIIELNGAASRAWRDGVFFGPFNPLITELATFFLHNRDATVPNGDAGMNGRCAAITGYSTRVLTDEERNGIGLFYADRFGLTWNP